MALTELEIRNAKPGAKIVKLSDGGGLQLWILPDGAKRWRLAYRFNGAQKVLAIGVYPAIGLKDAREARERPSGYWPKDRTLLSQEAGEGRQSPASANTFAAMRKNFWPRSGAKAKPKTLLGKLDWLLVSRWTILGPAHL